MEKKHHHRNGRENPSFSSTLLDAIYRSLDEEEELVLYKETSSRKKQTSSTTASMRNSSVKKEEDEMRKACMIEKWMEKKVSEKVVYRRNSLPDFDRKTIQNDRYSSKVFHSASSSSDSSCGELFSSSEAESWYGSKSSQRPKPIRTTNAAFEKSADRRSTKSNKSYEQEKQGGSAGGGFNKTKSKALKIYAELKKAKQPISPGGRLSSFLNSLFTSSGHVTKKSTKSSSDRGVVVEERKVKSTQTSTCSSASSFSRSCLSKTPSTRSKQSNNGVKRSVRFYPVSVIVDEDSRPCGHKCLQEDEPKQLIKLNEEFKFRLMEKNRRIEEAARDLLKNYREKTTDLVMRDQEDDESDDDDDDDDAASDASSDLFELDNLGAIGIQRYREELPVYETTYLEKNRAIANGFM